MRCDVAICCNGYGIARTSYAACYSKAWKQKRLNACRLCEHSLRFNKWNFIKMGCPYNQPYERNRATDYFRWFVSDDGRVTMKSVLNEMGMICLESKNEVWLGDKIAFYFCHDERLERLSRGITFLKWTLAVQGILFSIAIILACVLGNGLFASIPFFLLMAFWIVLLILKFVNK